jgi:hypothetical protein
MEHVASEAATGTAETTQVRKRPGMAAKTARDMVLSMLVVIAAGFGIYLFVPHSGGDGVHPLSSGVYNAAVDSARRTGAYPVLAPEGLGSGYRATAAEYDVGDASGATWHLGFIDPSGQYVALEQSNGTQRQQWLADVTTNAVPAGGSATISGQKWQRYQGDRYRALVLTTPKDTIAVTGTESYPDLEKFAAALR